MGNAAGFRWSCADFISALLKAWLAGSSGLRVGHLLQFQTLTRVGFHDHVDMTYQGLLGSCCGVTQLCKSLCCGSRTACSAASTHLRAVPTSEPTDRRDRALLPSMYACASKATNEIAGHHSVRTWP
ncbi:hypothetical protein V8C86DRAFT_2980755 [Haematococcus lacustris]